MLGNLFEYAIVIIVIILLLRHFGFFTNKNGFSTCSDGKTRCEGCQCCPDGKLCPNVTGCPPGTCGSSGGNTPVNPPAPSTGPVQCPNSDAMCDGCQCCPGNVLCPNAKNCPDPNMCDGKPKPPKPNSPPHNIKITNSTSINPLYVAGYTHDDTPPKYSGPGPFNGKNGIAMKPGETQVYQVPAGWNGRIWARAGCTGTDGSLQCSTGDCGPNIDCDGHTGVAPATLAEFTLDWNNQDDYDISLVDGYNLSLVVNVYEHTDNATFATPANGCDKNAVSCKPTAMYDAGKCPDNFKVIDKITGQVTGCMSACAYYSSLYPWGPGDPKYHPDDAGLHDRNVHCCGGDYNCSPLNSSCPPGKFKCDPTTWAANENTAALFADLCPDAYSFAYSDNKGNHTCTAGKDFEIIFYDPSGGGNPPIPPVTKCPNICPGTDKDVVYCDAKHPCPGNTTCPAVK